MNDSKKKIEITETDIEEMCMLAEDVMHELYVNYADYDAEGNNILKKYYDTEGDYEKDIRPRIRAERRKMFEDSNCNLLYDLFRRGDDIGEVRYYTKEDVLSWIEPILSKALQIFRKGTGSCGETDFIVKETVPDDYLTAIFAREVRNMMMIFAGQKLQRETGSHELSSFAAPSCHDGDEGIGIYYDDESLEQNPSELETARLILRLGNNQRDNENFLKMLRQDGDFRNFSGVAPTEKNILMFENYFESQDICCYAIFDKEHIEQGMIGYVGLGIQKQRFEVEFYVSKPYRSRGYCTEALERFIKEVFAGRLLWRNQDGRESELVVDTLYATVIAGNLPAVRVLDKCGFIKNPEIAALFQMLLDTDNNMTYENDIEEYILRILPQKMKE